MNTNKALIDFDEHGRPGLLKVGGLTVRKGDWVALKRDVKKYGTPRAGFPMVEVCWMGEVSGRVRIKVALPGAKSGGFVNGEDVAGLYFGGVWEMAKIAQEGKASVHGPK